MTQTQHADPGAGAGSGRYADELRAHDYDGIQEFDNHLPNWWLWTFYGACIFALFYWLFYHGLAIGNSSFASYRQEMDEAAASRVVENVTDDSLIALSQDSAAVNAGKEVFLRTCIPCHGPEANGILGGAPALGPNLTDNAWIHGGAPTQIHTTITNGVGDKGMPTWQHLGGAAIQQVTAYLLSIRNTNVPGKPAQGEPYEGK